MLFPNGAEIAASTATTSAAFADLVRRGEAIRIARGLYARARTDQLDEVVRRNRYQVLALVAPGAVITDRSAFCIDHVAGDVLFACHDAPARDIELPGLRIRLRIGQPALTSDQLLPMGARPIAIASAARSILENTAPSRARSGPARTLAPDELEQQLVGWTQTRGAAFVVEALTSAIHLAKAPGFDIFERGVSHLEEIRNALQDGRPDGARSKALRAVASGTPFDVKRIERFQTLLTALSQYDHAPKQAHGEKSDALPFFEAYFSNFIEGTEFAVEEAERIVFEGALPAGRTQDAHDVRCTYTLTHDHDEMATTPTQAVDLIKLATTRHRIMMASRPDKRPGKFKLERNQAGATAFVHPASFAERYCMDSKWHNRYSFHFNELSSCYFSSRKYIHSTTVTVASPA